MRLCQDECQLGVWAYCNDCAFRGDLIDIFVSYHKVTESVAVSILEEEGLLSGRYNADTLLQNRRRYLKEPANTGQLLWDEASRGGRIVVDPNSTSLLSRMHLRVSRHLSWSTQLVGRTVGFCPARRIEKLMRDNSRNIQSRVRDRKFSLPGEVDSALVLPFYDSPGRITSFTFMHSPHKSTKWGVYDHFLAYGPSSQPYQEGGIAMHPHTMTTPNDGVLVLTSDPATYLKMQLKHGLESTKPLQLACYRDGDVRTNSWQFVANRDLILWRQGLTPEDFYLAIKLNSQISTFGPNHAPLETACRHIRPKDVYAKIVRNAVFWPKKLAKLIAKLDVDDLTDWLIRMSLNTAQQQMVLDECPTRFRDKLKRALGDMIVSKSIPMGDGLVEQRTDGWFYVRNNRAGELITNAPFWIDYAINQTTVDGREQLYGVRAKYSGQEVTFEAPVKKFEKDPFSYVQDAMISNGVGAPSQSPSWRSKAHYLSLQFQSPTIVRRSSVMGYSKTDNCFYLPRYVVDAHSGAFEVSAAATADGLPGRSIRIGRIFNEQLDKFFSCDSADAYLSIFTGLMTQVLAFSADIQVPQLLFRSKTLYRPFAQVSNVLGIPVTNQVSAKKIAREVQHHRWPLVAGLPAMLPTIARRSLLRTPNIPLGMPTSLCEQLYGELSGTAVTLDSPPKVSLIPLDTLRVLQSMAGSLIQFYFKHRLVEKLHNLNNPAYGTLSIIDRWLQDRGINYPTAATKELIHGDRLLASSLPRALAMLVSTSSLKYKKSSSRDKIDHLLKRQQEPAVYRIQEHGHDELFVPRDAIMKTLANEGAPKIDHGEMASRLAEEGYKVRIEMVGHEIGFTIDGPTFDWYLRRRKAAASRLRLIGG